MRAAVTDALAARFREDLGALRPPPGRIGVAVSGGPDSLALLLLAATSLPGQVEAATVDHGLRAGSADEAAFVASVCGELAVPHATLAVSVQPGNVQSEARAARYGALAAWGEARGIAAVLTGHHADDQAETLLLRLNRGSGVAGLAGVRARGLVPDTRLPLLRPLLTWRREELAAIVASAGLRAVADPSNTDPRFDRARLRDALVKADWLNVPALAASAAHLADADAALEWAAAREWSANVIANGPGITYRPGAPKAIVLRVVERILRELGEDPRGGQVAQLCDTLTKGTPASMGGLIARPSFEGWSFSPAPKPRRA